jgi:hypothetical protein
MFNLIILHVAKAAHRRFGVDYKSDNRTKKNSMKHIMTKFSASLLLGVIVSITAGCEDHNNDDVSSIAPVTGAWSIVVSFDNLTYTPPTSGFSMSDSITTVGQINQEGTQLFGIVEGEEDSGNVTIALVIDNPAVSVGSDSTPPPPNWTITCTGLYDGNSMHGSWTGIHPNGVKLSNGTWSADRE